MPMYTVHRIILDGGKPYFEIRNNATGHIAAHIPRQGEAEEYAEFLNVHRSREADPDWTPGSRHNWWERNRGEERVA